MKVSVYIPEVWAADLSSLGWHPQILSDQLTLSQPRGTDYAHHITTGTPRFSDLPTALNYDGREGSYLYELVL